MIANTNILRLASWYSILGILGVALLSGFYFLITSFIPAEQLGLYALVYALCMILTAMTEHGFTTSLIQAPLVFARDYLAVFLLNLGLVLSLGGLTIAILYVLPLSGLQTQLPLAFSLVLIYPVVGAFTQVQRAGLKRKLQFKQLAVLDFIGTLSFVIVGYILAIRFQNFWSLIFALVAKQICMVIFLFVRKINFLSAFQYINRSVFIPHLTFGMDIVKEKSLTTVMSHLDSFLIAAFLDLKILGVYDIFKKILLRPGLIIYQYLEDVVFSLLSKRQNKPLAYNRTYRDFISLIGMIIIPAYAILYLFAGEIITLFPDTFSEMDRIFRLLVIFALAIILLNPLDMILYSQGQSGRFFRWYFCCSLIQIAITILALQHSISSYLIALSVLFTTLFFLSYFFLIRSANMLTARSFFVVLTFYLPFFFCLTQNVELLSPAVRVLLSFGIVILNIACAYYVGMDRQSQLSGESNQGG